MPLVRPSAAWRREGTARHAREPGCRAADGGGTASARPESGARDVDETTVPGDQSDPDGGQPVVWVVVRSLPGMIFDMRIVVPPCSGEMGTSCRNRPDPAFPGR